MDPLFEKVDPLFEKWIHFQKSGFTFGKVDPLFEKVDKKWTTFEKVDKRGCFQIFLKKMNPLKKINVSILRINVCLHYLFTIYIYKALYIQVCIYAFIKEPFIPLVLV